MLGVVGNVSCDTSVYDSGEEYRFVGGAALHIALAAAKAGWPSAPITVLGLDLEWVKQDHRFEHLNFDALYVVEGSSCSFRIIYDDRGHVRDFISNFGVATNLTEHACNSIGRHAHYHVCCRRPLEPLSVLQQISAAGLSFSLDFHIASVGASISSVLDFLPTATAIFVNAEEYNILATSAPLPDLRLLVVSDGAGPVHLFGKGLLLAVVQPQPVAVHEVTGAGDVLAGTFLAHLRAGLGAAPALHMAVSAASSWVQEPRFEIPNSCRRGDSCSM